MSNIRCKDDLLAIISQGQLTHSKINSSSEALNARWASLRENYQGLGAEDVEGQVALIFQQTEQLLEKLSELNGYCTEQVDLLEGQQ